MCEDWTSVCMACVGIWLAQSCLCLVVLVQVHHAVSRFASIAVSSGQEACCILHPKPHMSFHRTCGCNQSWLTGRFPDGHRRDVGLHSFFGCTQMQLSAGARMVDTTAVEAFLTNFRPHLKLLEMFDHAYLGTTLSILISRQWEMCLHLQS